ncbi:MAG: hypothetical protein QF561_07750 [Phycisphaerales bacterium]|jgi:hypothetical protein|nr:hypothetical protein [Phycisphaerales bacterium]
MHLRFIAIVMLAFTAFAQATSVVRMPLSQVADFSGQIVIGEVGSVESYWADEPRRIESRITLRNTEFLKGGQPGQRTLSFTVPGGSVGTWQARVAGAPEFRVGERWALCLLPAWKSFPTAGVHQGAFRLTSEGTVLDGRGQRVQQFDEHGFIVIHGSGSPLSSDAFLSRLREAATASRPVAVPRGAPVRLFPEYRPTSLKLAAQADAPPSAPPPGIEQAPSPSREASP